MTGKKSAKKSGGERDSEGLGLLLAVGAVGWVIVHLIWWILAAALLAAAALGIRSIVRVQLLRRKAHSAYQAAMVARADQQNDWAISGDERGIYGNPGTRPIEPPRPWSARRLTAVIGGATTVALVGAFLLVHHPSFLTPRSAEPAQNISASAESPAAVPPVASSTTVTITLPPTIAPAPTQTVDPTTAAPRTPVPPAAVTIPHHCSFPTAGGWCEDANYIGNPLCSPDHEPDAFFCSWRYSTPGSWKLDLYGKWQWVAGKYITRGGWRLGEHGTQEWVQVEDPDWPRS